MDKESLRRYSRQISVESIGCEGQEKLLGARVGIIGCGALGSLASMYVAAAGIGRIGIVDFDTVDVSNLQRQLFYQESNAGMKKVEVLASRIQALNSSVQVDAFEKVITSGNIDEFLKDYDFIIDATDNAASKFLIDRHCKSMGKCVTTGGVAAMRGQITTCMPDSRRFEALYPEIEEPALSPCSAEGVIGPAAGVLASMQASESIKYFTSPDHLLVNRLLLFDLQRNFFQLIEY